MQPYQDFSSWQPEQERQFVVFEQRSVEASKRAWAVGLFSGIALGIAVIGIVVAIPSEKRMTSAATEGAALPAEIAPDATRPAAATTPAPAPAQTAPAQPAPVDPAAPAEAAPAAPVDAPVPAAGADTAGSAGATAPAPPPGATKAPPTDLVKDKK